MGSVPGLLLGKVAHSGSRPNSNAVVSATPTIAKTMSIIAVAPFSFVRRLPEQGKQSVTAITFWSFSTLDITQSAQVSETKRGYGEAKPTYCDPCHRYQSANKYSAIERSSAMTLGSRADLQYAGLGGASLTPTKTSTIWWVSSKKSPARRTQRGSRADLEAWASRPKAFSHKR
jgi:hypothetical protein